MAAPAPRLYLSTPYMFEPKPFAERLARALDAGDVACVRIRLRGVSDDELLFAVDALRPSLAGRDASLLISDAPALVARAGVDGVHLHGHGAKVAEARALLGHDAVIGVGCGGSRHHALIAGESGADYVSFGPIASATHPTAERATLEWWQEMIELPVVAEGGLTPTLAADLVGVADFVAVARGVWDHADGPAAGVRAYLAALGR